MSEKQKIIYFLIGAALLGLVLVFGGCSAGWGLVALAAAGFFYCYTQLAFWCLIGYLPFQLALNLAPDIDLLSGRVLILLLFSVWLIKTFKEKKAWRIKNQAALALVLFFLIALLSILIAQNPAWGARKIMVFLSVFPLFFLIPFFVTSAGQLKKMFWIITASASLSALVALVQFLGQFVFSQAAMVNFFSARVAPLFWGQTFGQTVVQNPSWFVSVNNQTIMRAIGLFPDPHMLAFYLGLTLPLVLALSFYEKKYRVLLIAVCCLLFSVLILTFSRGGYMGLIAGLLTMAFLAGRHFGKKTRLTVAGVFFAGLTIIALASAPITVRFLSSFDLSESSNSQRLKIWNESLRVAQASPLLGVGLGNYPLSINFNEKYRSAVTSHNLYLDFLAETGIFGLLAWLWFFWSSLKNVLAKTKKDFFRLGVWGVGLFGSLIYFGVHSFFETAVFNPTILAYLMVIAGLSISLKELKNNVY